MEPRKYQHLTIVYGKERLYIIEKLTRILKHLHNHADTAVNAHHVGILRTDFYGI